MTAGLDAPTGATMLAVGGKFPIQHAAAGGSDTGHDRPGWGRAAGNRERNGRRRAHQQRAVTSPPRGRCDV